LAVGPPLRRMPCTKRGSKRCGASVKRKTQNARRPPGRARWHSTRRRHRRDHPYLASKGIKAHAARLHNGALVIPVCDGGELHSLQFIAPDGNKRFLTGGRVAGCYFSIGTLEGAVALCIAEGFATGASIHEATGYPVAVAFNAGNLEPVTRALRGKYPDLPLILCADDDAASDCNPGLRKATAAARALGGLLAIPEFGANRSNGATDFNDMAQQCGAEAVGRAIASASASMGVNLPAELRARRAAILQAWNR
jgi:putative DNA primase/helicase